jgi:hypothetical protein
MSALKANFEGNWADNHNKVSLNVPLIVFEEDDTHIVYCPPLEVYGYGTSESEAFKSFEVCLAEFFKYTINKKTFVSELTRLGWAVKKNKHKPMTPPPMTKLLADNDNFSRIFNNFSFRKEDHQISMPV